MKTLHLPESIGILTALSWDPTGRQIAGVSDDGMVVVWNVTTGQVAFARHIANVPLLTVAWSRNGRCLAVGGEKNSLSLLHVYDGDLMQMQNLCAPVKKVAWAPRGDRFLVAAGTMIYLYHARQSAPVQLEQPSPILDVAWSPTGGRFAAVCSFDDVFVYNVVHKRTVYALNGQDINEPCSVAWNFNGRDVAIGTANGNIQIHDGSTGQLFTTYSLSKHRIAHLAWSLPWLAALDEEEMTLWDVLPREHSGVLAHRYPSQRAFAFSPSGAHIATGRRDSVCIAPID